MKCIKGNNYTDMKDGTMEIELTKGNIGLIDKKDYKILSQYTWHATKTKQHVYAKTNIRQENGKLKGVFMHRLLLDTPYKMDTDHINHNGIDNRRSNLRVVTRGQNNMNRGNNIKPESSQYKGITKHKTTGMWLVRIAVDSKRKFIGYFKDEIEAAIAYDVNAIALHGKYACLNFPQEIK